ncbi:MAG: hypothetical protein JRM99_02600 [Nitrososphaerota archaeon]|nr:hypothetical protein [Nitrososphaerota archaeon]
MAFLRVVEVLPPLFRVSAGDLRGAKAAVGRLTSDVRKFRRYADIFLVANVKDPNVLKLDTVHLASTLHEALGVDSAPVIVVRDQNRPQFLASVLTALVGGAGPLMVAWGDDYPGGTASNVRDFESLAGAVAEASRLRRVARPDAMVLAPVNVERLSEPRELALAEKRLAAGADLLLAQPPTTDAGATFERHLALLDDAGLRGKVLLSVFPFMGRSDVSRYERMFGWRLPASLHAAAKGGRAPLLEAERAVVRRMRREHLPGVYLSTRGDVSLARDVLS